MCQMMCCGDEEVEDVSATEMINVTTGFTALRITHLQRRWRLRRRILNEPAGFQPSVDTGFQPKAHSLFEPAAHKPINPMLPARAVKNGWFILSNERTFTRDNLTRTESSFPSGCSPESKGANNSGAGFQPSADTGFQAKGHSPFKQPAPKNKPKKKSEKLPSNSEAFARLFVGDKVDDRASSATTRFSPEDNDAKNSAAGFQPSVDRGFQPKDHSLVEQPLRSKEMARRAKLRLAYQRWTASPRGNEVRRRHNKPYYERAKRFRKFLRTPLKEPQPGFHQEASRQDTDGEPSPKPISCIVAPPFIRGKLVWHRGSLTWKLNLRNPPELLEDYLTRKKFNLTVAQGLNDYDFHKARTDTYTTAIMVWNALDRSDRLQTVFARRSVDEEAARL